MRKHLGKSIITRSGAVTVPKAVRDVLGIKPGDKVDFVFDPHGDLVIRKVAASTD